MNLYPASSASRGVPSELTSSSLPLPLRPLEWFSWQPGSHVRMSPSWTPTVKWLAQGLTLVVGTRLEPKQHDHTSRYSTAPSASRDRDPVARQHPGLPGKCPPPHLPPGPWPPQKAELFLSLCTQHSSLLCCLSAHAPSLSLMSVWAHLGHACAWGWGAGKSDHFDLSCPTGMVLNS